jgi:hypothetical protein
VLSSQNSLQKKRYFHIIDIISSESFLLYYYFTSYHYTIHLQIYTIITIILLVNNSGTSKNKMETTSTFYSENSFEYDFCTNRLL